MAVSVSPEMLTLGSGLPDQVDGPIVLAFHLPGDPIAIRAHARAVEQLVDEGEETEHSERRGLVFIDLEENAKTRIEAYLKE